MAAAKCDNPTRALRQMAVVRCSPLRWQDGVVARFMFRFMLRLEILFLPCWLETVRIVDELLRIARCYMVIAPDFGFTASSAAGEDVPV